MINGNHLITGYGLILFGVFYGEEIFRYINTILKKKPKSLIYHYSDQKGLLGIIKSKSLWATSIHYLNDSTEYSYAIKMAKNEIGRNLKSENDEISKKIYVKLEQRYHKLKTLIFLFALFQKMEICLVSGEGMAEVEAGFSIGFDYSDLKEGIEKQGFIIAPCIYNQNEQLHIIQELIIKIFIIMKIEKKNNYSMINL